MHLVIHGPAGPQEIEVEDEEGQAIVSSHELYISFYNMSGQLPLPDDFGPGLWIPGKEQRVTDRKLLLESNPKYLLMPAGQPGNLVQARLGTTRLMPARGRRGIWSADLQMERKGWITHFAIGTKDRIIRGGVFEEPTPVDIGNGFSFGLELHGLQLEPPAPTPLRLLLGEKE